MRDNSETPLSELKNFGPKSADWLYQVGIETLNDLEALGAVEAYLRVKHRFPKQVSLHLLYALQATLMNLRWNELPPDIKAELKVQVME